MDSMFRMFRKWSTQWITALIMVAISLSLNTAAMAASRYGEELDGLFAQLAKAPSLESADQTIAKIWQLWTTDTTDSNNIRLMRRGIAYMESGQWREAESIFSQIIDRDDGFSEAWNKRATVRFMLNDMNGSVQDIAQTLKLEPRHFGALSGLGMIHTLDGNFESALSIYEQILTIHPLNPEASRLIEELKLKLRGDPA
jgi:tetratricopeptide (TPR) repeat protein